MSSPSPSDPRPGPRDDPPNAEPELPTQQISHSASALSSSEEDLATADRLRVAEHPHDWKDELSERVENFRKRRARLQPEAEPAENLELDFESTDNTKGHPSIDDALRTPKVESSDFDLEIGEIDAAHSKDGPSLGMPSLEVSGDEAMQFDAAPAEVVELSLGESLAKNPPMEILVSSPTTTTPDEAAGSQAIYLASLGHRFLAGLTDVLVLLLGAAVFGIIIWRVCGRLSLVPLNIAALGTVAVILIFAYFAVFTAIASATPGLLWMRCEIRNLQGGHPTVHESFWRAFGVLVSLSALMLGFVWACVDSDGLTWHDRMSGTVITQEHNAADLAGLKVGT